MSEYLFLIPARGGSKSIPRKNLKILAGKPLIAWSIESALNAKARGRVVVSTDDDEIAKVALSYGAEVPFRRPSYLATDEAQTEPVIIHAIRQLAQHLEYRPKAVVLLQPTSPIRKPGTIDKAISKFESSQANSLLSVREIHPFLWRAGKDSAISGYDYRNRPRRQDIAASDVLYEENGSIYITELETLMKGQNRLGGRIELFVIDSIENCDIDTLGDFEFVAALLKGIVIQ